MKNHIRTLSPVLLTFFVGVGAQLLNAQITNPIQAHVDHSFVIGEKTLPPGEYTFRLTTDPDQSLMIVSQNGKADAQFLIRQSIDDHTPRHSELVFRKYGDTEFLSKIYEAGSKEGAAITQPSKEEVRLIDQGQHALEHSEVQK
jgi:hypothetical protein